MDSEAFITGLGLITALGRDVNETWNALLAGEFIRTHAKVDSDPESPARTESPCHSRVARLGLHVAREAIGNAGWGDDIISDPETALIVGTSKGPVETWLNAPPRKFDSRTHDVGAFGLAELTDDLAREIGHGPGPRSTLSAACASGIHALIHAAMLLRSGVARRALVVAAEASVHPLFLGSFKRLGVLPAEGVGCRPFDLDRDGFLMSEAAAAVCLESDETLRTIARVERFALGSDATHITGGDPDGKTLKYLLAKVINARPVDLIHAHATGTVLNDPVELVAIESVLHADDARTNIYSHKGALGHSLGAAGMISVVLNCKSHQTGLIPPNTRTERPLPMQRVLITRESVRRPIRRSVAVASGFGGAMGVVSLVS